MENPFDQLNARFDKLEKILLELKQPENSPKLSDRIGLNDACLITELSKASIYSMTHNNKIPFKKFGSRLIFSRRELIQWMDNMTVKKESPADLMKEILRKSANKKLKKSL